MELSDSRLKYLYESFRRGTMRAASEHFDVAPSSISRQITSLERELGLLLVEKGRHTVTLTEAGKLLVDFYSERLTRNETVLAELDDLRGMRTGHVRIAAGQSLISTILARVIFDYREKWPGIRVHVNEIATQQVLAAIAQDEAHFGIVLNPPKDPQLKSRFSFSQSLQAVVRADHPLANQSSVSLEDLQRYPLVLPTQNFRSRQMLDEIAIAQGLKFDPVMTVSSIYMLMNCIRAGVGIGLLANIYLDADRRFETLVSIPIENEVLTAFEVHAMVRLGRSLPASVNVFLEMLEREISVSAQAEVRRA